MSLSEIQKELKVPKKHYNKFGDFYYRKLEDICEAVKPLLQKYKWHLKIEDALIEDYDGFVIATPAKTHFEIAKNVINAGKHILIEKPMTLSIKEARELVNLADKNKINAIKIK